MGLKRAAPEAVGPEFQFEWKALRGLVGEIDDSISQLEPEQKKYKSEEKVVNSDEEPAKESGEEQEDDSESDKDQKAA
ncbi:hypothetical protein KL930_000730 [Ogataea haglerorum]|uniref:EKC/KEOPS complex subunit GON7 n=1 Tax=Ogataea haglerorum TaxID=1937702 RepID=A0ABQ7RNY1_9ASCO|nr:uncharacterized protein KL911_003413 [Ogataea haglerorum]KAG7700043.1 hypothetical protein KL915_000732 [Ogataea haglerorum]KAG7701701.1 hypothetical protein KL951_000157 [Ogataea haglerorum]KAG7711514.1 hypothetical protein KL914_000156 [Ogataea haglerorum]KAG7712285.1 hypothetical protein KL950_000156 [Ogataea haglerorum]KAG7722338.1 hypothetical protein KL913_000158 [Ogataea haglerorum]